MSGRVLPFAGSEHAEVQRLLPWYVQDTLESDELTRVRRHLDECERCRSDADELREWAAALSRHAQAPPTHVTADSAIRGLARLRPRLRLQRTHAPLHRPHAAGGWSSWRRAPAWLRWTAAVQAVVILLAAGGLLVDQRKVDRRESVPPARYRTLGDVPAPPRDPAGHRLVVVFDPHAQEARVQELLQANQARIVDGPSETGAYVLLVPSARAAAVRSALRAAPEVRLAESLDPAQ